MVNTMAAWWPNLRHQCNTWVNGTNKGWLDHIYASTKLIQEGSILQAGIETGGTFYKSDHCIVGVQVNFTKLIGRIQGMPKLYKPRKRVVMAGVKDNKEQYRRIAQQREDKQKKKTNPKQQGLVQWGNDLEEIANDVGRGSTGDVRVEAQREIDKIYHKMVKELLAIEEDQQLELNKFGGANTRHQWSDVFGRKSGILRLLQSTIRYCTQRRKRNRVSGLVKKIIRRSKDVSDDVHMTLDKTPDTDANERDWYTYTKQAGDTLAKMQTTLHLRARVKWRRQMRKWKYNRDAQRKKAHEVKKYYNYALKRTPPEKKPTVLYERKDGEMKVIEGKENIYKREVEFAKKHMGEGRERWYIHNGKLLPAFRNDEHGKQWRKDLQDGKLTEQQWKEIPKQLKGVFKCARACVNKDGKHMTAQMYGDIFTSPVTLEELDRYLARAKKNTAPGVSGVRIDHIAALPDDMRKAIAQVLSVPYLTGIGFSAWREEIVNWVPKEEGNPDINKRRPLVYYEIMRKMCMAVRVRRVAKVWRDNGIIDENNYAFLAGKSTMQPLMIKKMILEEAAQRNKELTMIDVDFSKAYDSTERFAKEISLRRMGFPEEGLEMWQMFDGDRNMRVLTAFGLTKGFTPECGAWGQGAVESPPGWLCFMCWLSAYVEKNTKEPYVYGQGEHKRAITKVIYADDGTYFQRSRKGGQRAMDCVSNFATATGIVVKPTKSYLYANRSGRPITITTHERSNTNYNLRKPARTALTELGDDDFFRHLGNIQNAKGECTIQNIEMYDGSEQTNIFEKVARNMAALQSRNITAGGALQVLKSVVIRQILYPTTFANLDEVELDKLQRKVQTAMRNKLRVPRHMQSNIIYMHEDMGGLGEDAIIDIVNMNRLITLMMCLEQGGEMKCMMLGAIQRMQEHANITTSPLSCNVTHYIDPMQGTWLYHLKVWMEKHDITIQEWEGREVIIRYGTMELTMRKKVVNL